MRAAAGGRNRTKTKSLPLVGGALIIMVKNNGQNLVREVFHLFQYFFKKSKVHNY